MLTPKQLRLLLYINRRIRDTGTSPSFDEMRNAIGVASKSGIHRLVQSLEERGFIRRLPYKARALEVLRLPTDAGVGDEISYAAAGTGAQPFFAEERDTYTSDGYRATERTKDDVVLIPHLGALNELTTEKITKRGIIKKAGRVFNLPSAGLLEGDFALDVKDESLASLGVLPGDTVMIKITDGISEGKKILLIGDANEFQILAREAVSDKLDSQATDGTKQIFGYLSGLVRSY